MPNAERKLIDLSIFSIIKFFLVVIALYFLYIIKDVLAILFVSIILASAVDPWVDRLEKIKFPRWLSILLIYVVLLLIFAVVIILIIPPLVTQVTQLALSFPAYTEKLSEVFNTVRNFSLSHGLATSFGNSVNSIQGGISSAAQSVFSTVFGVFGGILSFIIILVIVFYMTVEENAVKRSMAIFVPRRYEKFTLGLVNKVQAKIGSWLKGQLLLCLIVGLMSYIGLLILGVNYALILALVAGIGELIPFVGQFTSAALAIFLTFTQSPIKALFVFILYVVIQQFENNFIVPKVMQRAVGLNPILILVALLIGAQIGGVLGLLLAIPVATSINVIVTEVWAEKETNDAADALAEEISD